MTDLQKLQEARDALAWILKIAELNYDDVKLKTNGARTLARIADKAHETLEKTK